MPGAFCLNAGLRGTMTVQFAMERFSMHRHPQDPCVPVERNMDRKVEVDRASKQVDVRRLKLNVRTGG